MRVWIILFFLIGVSFAEEPIKKMSMEEFLATEIDGFSCKNIKMMDAIELLRSKFPDRDIPQIKWSLATQKAIQNEQVDIGVPVTLELKKVKVGELLRYISELTGCLISFHEDVCVFHRITTLGGLSIKKIDLSFLDDESYADLEYTLGPLITKYHTLCYDVAFLKSEKAAFVSVGLEDAEHFVKVLSEKEVRFLMHNIDQVSPDKFRSKPMPLAFFLAQEIESFECDSLPLPDAWEKLRQHVRLKGVPIITWDFEQMHDEALLAEAKLREVTIGEKSAPVYRLIEEMAQQAHCALRYINDECLFRPNKVKNGSLRLEEPLKKVSLAEFLVMEVDEFEVKDATLHECWDLIREEFEGYEIPEIGWHHKHLKSHKNIVNEIKVNITQIQTSSE